MRPSTRIDRARQALLACGILAAIVYVVTDVVAAARWDGYDYASQTVSELMGIGAPTRPFVVAFFVVHDVLLIAFAAGIWLSTTRRARRVTALLLIAIGVLGMVAAPFFPMHPRGAAATFTDTMHVALTGALSLLIIAAIAIGAEARGQAFRPYSIGTLLVVALFGALTGIDGARIAAGLPTPWIGITERICIYGYLLWLLVLATREWTSGGEHRLQQEAS
jgi:hypothetical protein